MKILMIADEECSSLWDFYDPKRTKGVDLIISCGDLSAKYLEFLVTMVNCPLLYVSGNHDTRYVDNPPQGCICIDDKIYDYKGLRIMGLGGSMCYNYGPYQYTEQEMEKRMRKLNGRAFLMNGIDILVTHAPAKGYGDLEDLPHQGFECFNTIMNRWHPRYMLHGHVHQTYGKGFESELKHESGTEIINAYRSRMIEIGEHEYPSQRKTGSAVYDFFISLTNR
ncbi:MAG: metallophosphoesterase family protein [Lachnospiraceae bacterium]|nr:metallophosphoesterase family protein [Lachnospiraceae bacterium]